MFKTFYTAIIIVLILKVGASAQVVIERATPTRLYIKTNGYNGNYAVHDESRTASLKYVSGDTMINVYPKTPYSIINGANIGHPGQPFNGAIWFYVSYDGTISGIEPAFSVILHDSIMELQTTPVEVDPGAYTGQYQLSIFENTAHDAQAGLRSGKQSITLIKGLTYYIKTAGACHCGPLNLHQNYIYYNLDEDGNVLSLNPKAIKSSGHTLTFLTKPFSIDSSESLCKKSGALYINGYNKEPMLKPLVHKEDMVNIICNIATCIYAKEADGVKCQCLFPK